MNRTDPTNMSTTTATYIDFGIPNKIQNKIVNDLTIICKDNKVPQINILKFRSTLFPGAAF